MNTVIFTVVAFFNFWNWGSSEPAKEAPKQTATDNTREKVFTNIYENKTWGTDENGEAWSGFGSCIQATGEYRKYLEKFIVDNNIHTIADAGCGKWNYSKSVNWGDRKYTGYDVVAFVVENNKEKHGNDNISFKKIDFVNNEIPKADLLICKDVLQHLSNADVAQFLKQLPNFKYALITNDINPSTGTSDNLDVETGTYRQLDITQPPFNIKAEKVLTYKAGNATKQVVLIRSK